MSNRSRYIVATAGLAVGLGLLWLSVRNVNFAESRGALGGANFWLAIPILVSLWAFYRLKAMRWGRLLNPTEPVSYDRVLPSLMIGFAGNNLLPFRLGEALRVYVVGFDVPQSRSFALGTLVVERLFDLLAIALIVALSASLLPFAESSSLAGHALLVAVPAALLAIGLAALARLPGFGALADRLLQLLPAVVGNWLRPRLIDASKSFAVLRRLSSLPALAANSLAQWGLLAVAIYLSFVALDVNVTPFAAGIVLGLLVIGMSLPAAPGFVGTIEYCFVAGLGLFDVPASTAFGAAVFYHALTFGYVVSAGVFHARRYGALLSRFAEVEDLKIRGN